MKVEIRFSGPAVPVWPSHGPDGTRPSSDTSPATAVVVGVASALDGRREDEGCVVDGLSRLRGVTSLTFGTAVARAEQPTLPATKSAHSVTGQYTLKVKLTDLAGRGIAAAGPGMHISLVTGACAGISHGVSCSLRLNP